MAANPYRDNSGGNVPLGPGRVVLHYEVQEQAEFGGFGDVYVARDTRLDREVLLKTLPQNLAGDNKARASFTAAVSTAASLSHPNIAHVFDAGDVDGRPFAVFEPLNGSPLRTSFRDTYPTLGQTLDIVRQICVALQHAHQQGIVHGSLSPDCVWLDGAGWIQVVDFSFVTASTPSPGETRGEALEYRAPESWDGHPPDELTDIYATGLILYELV
ncbi:MAG: serine/threonine protein kinase, partial [candidate division Zixibacteria bacterium]|nr:serine/threonine protein kinase [candidate division Zixibacteria bacterium]